MSVERDIRYELIARLCPNATGAELKSVATEVSLIAGLEGVQADESGWYVCYSIKKKSGDRTRFLGCRRESH